MSDKTVVQKLVIKEGQTVLLVRSPAGYEAALRPLPPNVRLLTQPAEQADIIQVFVADRREMESWLPKLKPLLKPKGILWVTYYKGTSRHKTDINRDSVFEYARSQGLQAVAQVAVDDDWSALRLKVVD